MIRFLFTKSASYMNQLRMSTYKDINNAQVENRFVTVFQFPFVKYISIFNRLKSYHILGSSIAIPSTGLLEVLNVFPEQTFLSVAYVGVTGAAVLSLASLPFTNIIGFLYISEDNEFIKISSVNFWGKRIDKVINSNEWMPLLDMAPRKLDVIYLSPVLADKTKYKLFIKFGQVLNPKKIGEVLE